MSKPDPKKPGENRDEDDFAHQLERKHEEIIQNRCPASAPDVDHSLLDGAIPILELLEDVRRYQEANSLSRIDTPEAATSADTTTSSRLTHGAGRRIGRFEVYEQLGQGGFGVVLRGYDAKLDREVAIKIPRFEAALSDESQRRFGREAKAAAALNHPNIVAVHETGSDNGVDYIAYEFVNGPDLLDYTSSAGPFLPADAADLLVKLADAMEHAHAKGVLHRDLKPSNVLIDHASGEPRISDFGLAAILDSNQNVTQTGAALGTPAYMSPEQAAGRKRLIGPPTDVYGLGSILYHAISGQAPFQGETLVETMSLVQSEPPSTLRRFNSSCPPDLEAICLKCLEKAPSDRYASTTELKNDLTRFLRGESVSARRPSLVSRAWRWCRRHPVAATLLAMVVGIALVAPGIAISQNRLYTAATRARQKADRLLYCSDMNLALRDWDESNLSRIEALLQRHVPAPGEVDHRRFEWFYLNGLWKRSQAVPVVARMESLETMAVSPDGTILAIGNHQGEVALIELSSQKTLARWQAHPYHVSQLAFSADGQLLASSNSDSQIKVWNSSTQEVAFSASGLRAIAFSPNENTLAFRRDYDSIGIWSLESNATSVVSCTGAGAGALAFSVDGKLLYSGGWDRSFRVFDRSSGKELASSSGEHGMWTMACSANGEKVVTGDVYGTIYVWDARSGKRIHSFQAHGITVSDLSFVGNSDLLISSGEDNEIALWVATAGWKERRFRGNLGVPKALAVTGQDESLLVASDGKVRRWDIEQGAVGPESFDHGAAVASVAFSRDESIVATACSDGTARLYDIAKNQLVQKIPLSDEALWQVALAKVDGRDCLLATSADSRLVIWDIAARTRLRELSVAARGQEPHSFSISRDHQKLALVASRSELVIRELADNSIITSITVADVTDIAFSADSELLLVARDGNLDVYSASTGQRLHSVAAHSHSSTFFALSPDANTIASCSFDRAIKLWSFDPEEMRIELIREFKGSASPVDAIAFSPTGRTFVTSGDDRVIRFWDTERDGQQRGVLSGHISGVRDLAFSPDGQALASVSDDQTLRIWWGRPAPTHQ